MDMTPIKARLFRILEAGKTTDLPSVVFDIFMVVLILVNLVAFAAGTVEAIDREWGRELWLFNIFSVAVFTVEYVLRLWVCTEHIQLRGHHPAKARAKFAATPFMLIDLAAILPFYLSAFVPMDMRLLRVFRLIRFFKLARFSPAIATLGQVFYAERRALMAALIIMAGLLLVSSSLIYFAESAAQPEVFGSIPAAMWWAIATLTTVGYGDVVPVTAIGRMIGGVVMLFGLGMFALPIGIIATGFYHEIHRRDFIVTWSMVARVPLFAGLDAAQIADVVALLDSQIVEAGTVITRRGQPAERMYFILDGSVEIDLPHEAVALTDGDYFGEIALLKRTQRQATARALSQCQLLILEAHDFQRLMRYNPELNERVTATAEERLAAGNPVNE